MAGPTASSSSYPNSEEQRGLFLRARVPSMGARNFIDSPLTAALARFACLSFVTRWQWFNEGNTAAERRARHQNALSQVTNTLSWASRRWMSTLTPLDLRRPIPC
jgi:hypothetical protein